MPPQSCLAIVEEVLHQPHKWSGHVVEANGWMIANLADGYATEAEQKKNMKKPDHCSIAGTLELGSKGRRGQRVAHDEGLEIFLHFPRRLEINYETMNVLKLTGRTTENQIPRQIC